MPNEMYNNPQKEQMDFMSQDTPEEIANPQTNEEVYSGSMAAILSQNLGFYVIVEFLVGTNRLEIKEGILYSVGISFMTLYDPTNDRYIVCDLYSAKFVTFYNSREIPPDRLMMNNNVPQNNNNVPQSSNNNVENNNTYSYTQSETRTTPNINHAPYNMPYPPIRSNNRRMF